MTGDRVATELAALGARVEGLTEIVSQRMAHNERDLARLESDKDAAHAAINRRIDDLTEVVEGLENLRQRIIGGALVIGLTSGGVGAFVVQIAGGA